RGSFRSSGATTIALVELERAVGLLIAADGLRQSNRQTLGSKGIKDNPLIDLQTDGARLTGRTDRAREVEIDLFAGAPHTHRRAVKHRCIGVVDLQLNLLLITSCTHSLD